jgi:phospholipid/cholesterol/gamma-HCH transport system substrate-binding protein
MSERRLHAQVGFLFILSVLVLVLGILWFKEFKIRGATFRQTIEFQSTSGLVTGDPVEVKGVPSGKVVDIRFEEGLALVVVELDRTVKLYQDAHFSIESVGIMGQKMVSITPGIRKAGELSSDAIPKGEYAGGTTEVMSGVADALDTFQHIASRLDTLVTGFNTGREDQVGRTLDNLERASKDLALLLEDNRAAITQSVHSMSAAMDDIHAMLGGQGPKFQETLTQAQASTAHLDSALVGLDHTVARMDSLLARVEAGQGTVGKAFQDDAAYKEFVATLAEAKALLQDVRQNPKRYFKFSVF